MRIKERMKKGFSVLLALNMVLSSVPLPVFAAEGCTHHTEHTADCGYVAAVAGSACTHEHSGDCYAIVSCLHECGDECAQDCGHSCTVESGCITMERNCHHTHGDCGYSEGTAEVPCGHVHNKSCGYVEAVVGNPCANAETDPECDHSGDCGYVAAVEGQPCGHTACDDTCGYAPATEGTPCTHVCEVKVDSDDSCYKLLCSHKDGGHDDACGYVAAVEAHDCHYECAECAAALTAEDDADPTTEATTEPSTEATEPATEATEPAPVCDCGTDDGLIHATTCAVYVAPENPVCYCTEKCTEVNVWCDVCGFDYTACTGTDTAALYEDTTYPYAVVDTEAGTLTIDGTLGGKTTATEEDITALVEQLKAYVDSGNTTIIVTGSKPAMIEVSGLTITAIGEAIYRLSLDDSYNGKIDLILPDVTEIIDKEFYSAQALNSITLPKVTKLGSLAFYGTQYLRIITFGSVLTEVNETGGVMFAYVGNKVGGCDLILNCGQMNESSVPVPDLTINTWGYENEFKSITLTHTGGTATCSELAKCEVCGTEYGELGAHTAEPTYVPNAGDSTQHDATYSCCGATVTEAHTMNVTTGKCVCGADMTAIATVTDGTNTYYAADAATLNQAVTAILETGSRTFTVELPADAEAGMITTIRRAICDTEGVADGSIHLTLKGVTTIPGTTNWDGVAFGPGDIYDEAGKIVDQELVTQLASINLPDVTEIGAQAFYFCENLVSVSAPKAQTIGAQAFGYTALTSVEFPELTTIPTDMFSGTWTLSSAKFPKVTTIEQSGLLVGAKFTPENNPTPFPLELTAEGDITFNGSNHFNIKSQNYSGKVDLVLCCNKADKVTKNEDGTATWQVRDDLSYTFKSITFKHSYDDGKCTACGEDCTHTGGEATCTEKAICEACGTSYGEVDTTNHDSSVECVNGFCPNGCYEPATLNAAGYYEIDNAGKIFWFAQQVNVKGNREIKGVLTADIDLENKPWTPIGETGENNNNFRGVFDGQGHTIKGLYVEGGRAGLGFFGEVRTGTVKNFTIYGNVVVNTEVDYVGGVIGSICGLNSTDHGLERNGAIIQNITSFVNVTAKVHGIGMIGGFVGYANHQSLIEKCAWYGTFDAGEYHVDSGAGGFIGKIQENTSEVTIRNCGAYGTIKTGYEKNSYNNYATIYMGGFLSFSNTNAQTTLENCLFAGRFERGANLTDQAFLGAFGTLRSVKAIKNCYYLGDDGLEAVHSDSNLKPGSDNVEITSVTGEELRNNTIATQLGDHWMQDVHYPIPKDTKAHSDSATYTYTDNGDGTHKATCNECGYEETSRPHTIENHACTDCGAMEIVVSFDAGDYEWKTGDTLYFCRVSGDNEWEEYAFTATVAGDGTVTWTPDRTLYWDGTGEHKLVVIYPDTGYVWDTWYVDEDQATPETLRKNDRLDAIWSGNPTTDTITFNLKHRMAKVTVNYEAAEGVTISKAEVYTLTQYVFFDEDTLERRNIAWEEGHDLWINSYHNGNQFTAFVSPDAYAADGNFIKITLDDGTVYEVKMNKAVTFEEGAEYTYTVVITADGAYLTCADECTFEYTDNGDGTHKKVCSKCGYVAASENHTLTYTTNGSTITESCSANCGYSASLTLKAPANLVYDRTEKAATVEGEIIADYKLTYSANAVIMAGDYTATLTVGDYSVSLAFTIAKADPDVVTPSGLKATYGQTLADVELPSDWAWKNSSASVGSVGSNTFAAIYTPADISNFNTLERDLTVVVAKAMPTVTAPVAADDLVYNGTAQTLITAGTATGGTMQYSLDGSNWSETIPTGKDAKTYTVYYKVVGDSNHNDSSVDSVQVTIGKATLTVTADNKTMTTGQNLPTFTYTITGFVHGETEDVLTTKPTVSCEANGQTAGTYDITVSDAAADNYEITHVNGALSVVDHQHAWTYTAKDDTITATCNAEGCPDAEQSITISAVGKTYDGTPVTATLTGSIDGVATPEITYTGNTNAGTHTASITIEGKTASVKFTIEKATVTVTADAKSKPYGTDNPILTYTSEGLFGDDVLTGALETTATKTSNVGEYDITVGSLANSNYTINFVGAKLTITKAAAPEIQWPTAAALTYGQKLSDSTLTSQDENGTFAWQDGSIVPTVKNNGYVVVYTPKDTDNYDYTVVELTETIPVTVSKVSATVTAAPTPNTLAYTGEGQYLISAGVAVGGEMQYSTDNQTWSTTIPQGTDAGEYTVYYKVVGDENHSDTAVASIEVTIAKAQAVITVDTTTITVTYGETVLLPTATTNFGTVVCDKTADDLVNAGTYTVTYTVAGTENFEGATKTLTVKVEQLAVAEPTVTDTYTYTGSEQTVTLTGVESCMSITSGNKATNAGNHEVVITLDSNHKWADGSDGRIQWSIGKAEFGDVYVSPSGMLTYNGTAQTPKVNTDADSVGNQTATFAYRLTENESYGEMPAFTDAGTYTVYYKASAPNHKDATGSFTVTVDKAKAEIAVNTDPITVVYGEAVVLPTATTNFGTVACDKTASDLVNAGTYTVTYSVAGSDNYNGDTKTITVTVNAKVVNQPVIEGIEAVYILSENAITPVPTAVKDGATVIDPSEYTLAYENNTAAGTATVKIVDKDGGNYTVNGSMTFQIVEHEHTWTYTTDSNASKIIATCSNADGHCPNTNGGSVSIQDPDELTYDGSTKDAELVYESWQPEEVTITYNNVDRVNVTGKEIVASIGVVGAGIQSVYTIVAAALPNATLSADSGTYTGQAHTVTVVLDTLVKDTDYTVSIPEDMTNVGTKTITVNGKGNYEGTQNLTYTITKRSDVAAPAPGVGYTIDYAKETITIAEGFEVIDSDGKAVVSGSAADYFGKMLSVRYAETQNTEASAYTSFTLAERPAVPNVTIHNETIKGKADGKITGLDTTMEYSTDGGKHWVSVETTDAGEKNLTVGTTIAVRMKATQTAPCSESKTGTVAAGAAITVTYAENGQAADGMPAQVSDLSYGNKLTKPADPTAKNTDFAFRGWYKDAACTTAWDFAKDTVTEETVTLYAKWEQVYFSVTAEIKDHNNVEYHGEVEVKLMRGDSTIDSVTGTAGSFQFSRHVEGGMYNLVAIYTDSTGEHTKTELITVDHDETFVLKLPAPGVNSHLTVSDNAQTPDVMVGELDAEAESIKQQTGATKVEIEMTVTGKTENQVPATVVNAVEEATDNAAVEYLDITVTKQIDDGAKTEMSETTNLMEIVVPYNTNGKTNLRVFRHHDGQLQEFAQGRDADQTFYYASGYIHIFTKYFSNYMISYEVSHTVTFDANGGTVGTNSLTTQTNGTLSTLPTPTREHYVFKGWYTAKSGGTKVTTDTVFNGDATIYAQWGGYAITVADAKNGTVTVDRSEAPGATEITITVTPKTGYKMSALTVKDAAGKSYVISTDNNGKYYFTMPDADVTVKVTFSKTSTSTADTTNPKTGDSFLLVPFSSMAAASLLALAVLMLNKKKLYQK